MRKLCAYLGLLLMLLCHGTLAATDPLAELLRNGHLEISGAITPERGIVPGQKLQLTLTIATDRWFAGGTRISIPEVPGLVILQTEQFASNASETRNGQTWVMQSWTLDVYPQRAGNFTIPPMALHLKVNTEHRGDVAGNLPGPQLSFKVTIPTALSQAQQWVAAPSFELHQSFNRPLDSLEVGDALEREIVFEATDVMAMMLPAFAAEQLPGLSAYPSPPTLHNANNRGQTSATRSVRISYIAEAPGQYRLPARDYFWWDTTNGELQLLTLPESRVEVSGAAPGTDSNRLSAITAREVAQALITLVLLAALLQLARVFLPRIPLASWRNRVSGVVGWVRALRQPALPHRLNPGSSAED